MIGELFATARGYAYSAGAEHCFYCGTSCDQSFTSAKYVKQSFTSRDTVCGGNYVCGGCVAALDEQATIELPTGEVRTGQKTRCYSWVFNRGRALAATKAHREWLVGVCLYPPEPPFVVCLSDSGQKHLLYRGKVCHSREVLTVTLEAEPITFRPQELTERMQLAKRIAAAIGKPSLAEPLSLNQQMGVINYHGLGVEPVLNAWLAVQNQPLSRLAGWFCPAQKECKLEYPKS